MTAPIILIVDDNPMNLELVEYVLTASGYAIMTAGTAAEGFERMAQQRPDLILMDIQMPDLDGLEMTRRIKADPLMRDIIVVAFTAYAMKGDEQRVRQAGCDGYLSKPVDVKTLSQQVANLLAHGVQPPAG